MESNLCFLALLLLLLFPSKSSSFYLETPYLQLRHLPRPLILGFNKNDENNFKQKLCKPLTTVDQNGLIQILANTTGFKIASAILQNQQCSLTSLLLVDEIYKERNGTKLLIPNCDAITIYIMYSENYEKEILENNPGIIDDVISGRRRVVKEIVKKVSRFDGGLNLTVSRPFVYSDKEGVVVAHGANGEGFGAIESRINSLKLYGPYGYDDSSGRRGLRSGGVDYFELVEFPVTKEEETEIDKLSMKIEMMIVANIVPFSISYDYGPDSFEWNRLQLRYGDAEKAIARLRQWHMPYKMTLLYVLHF